MTDTTDPEGQFIKERARCADASILTDDDVRQAILAFADALDPGIEHTTLPVVSSGGFVDGHQSLAYSSGRAYLIALRHLATRGLSLLSVDAATVNAFFADYVTDPEKRRHGIVEYDGKLSRSSASGAQSALRQFYRFHTEPGRDRATVVVAWPADGTGPDEGVRIFSPDPSPVDPETLPSAADLDAMREACLSSTNTRRDRAMIELVGGTGQRITAILTLRIRDVAGHIDGDCNCTEDRRNIPHVLLNPAIAGNGDKGAIANAGRWRPVLSNADPIRSWLDAHPLRDDAARADAGVDADFADCFVLIGDPEHPKSDPSTPLSHSTAWKSLRTRKADTAAMPDVETVERPVNPHAWRHLCYTRSEQLPISEKERRAIFGWARGSTTGEELYGHEKSSQAAARFADAWHEEFDKDATAAIEQLAADGLAGDLSPEATQAIARAIVGTDEALDEFERALFDD